VIDDVNDAWRVTNQLLAYERGDDATTIFVCFQAAQRASQFPFFISSLWCKSRLLRRKRS
jgi:hypothetical protein